MTESLIAAPDATLPATGDQQLRLSDFLGRKVVVYFYPKDSTPGCTQQAQGFRDHFAEFAALSVVILGVSRDSVKSHENFKLKQALPFTLVSDAEEIWCAHFDVIKLKNMYGKQVRGIERSTFIVDEQGRVIKAWRKVRVKDHVAEVLAFLAQQ
jgi:thioredoxin-dependent peroxiredoxin